MDKRKLEELIALVEDRDIQELSISGPFTSVRIVRGSAPTPQPVAVERASVAAPAPIESAAAAEETPVVDDRDSGLQPVVSPMVGTFYAASEPGAEAYVRQGDHVSKGQVVCIVEAMKLLNEIESEVGGTVVRVLVDNAQPVEFGQKLFLIQPD